MPPEVEDPVDPLVPELLLVPAEPPLLVLPEGSVEVELPEAPMPEVVPELDVPPELGEVELADDGPSEPLADPPVDPRPDAVPDADPEAVVPQAVSAAVHARAIRSLFIIGTTPFELKRPGPGAPDPVRAGCPAVAGGTLSHPPLFLSGCGDAARRTRQARP